MNDNDEQLSETDAAIVAMAMAPLEPDPQTRARLKARILAGAHAESGALRTVHAAERTWIALGRGVDICELNRGEDVRTFLLRMQPGSRLPGHAHARDEECYLIEGDAFFGDDLYLTAGDYQFLPAGSTHAPMRSPKGCIALIRGQPRYRGEGVARLLARWL